MEYTEYGNADEFLAEAGPLLRDHESVNSLMLGLALRLRENPLYYGTQPLFATIKDGADIQLVVLMTPPYRLQVLAPAAASANHFRILAKHLLSREWPVPAVLADEGAARSFASAWSALTGCPTRDGMRMCIYELRTVSEIAHAEGEFRQATTDDFDRAVEWSRAFNTDVMADTEPDETARIAGEKLQDGTIFFWVDEQPVSMAARARPTPRGETISLVYTPPENRGHGYATALVASLAQKILAEGKQFCSLYSDLANPTSNSIYMKVGFVPVANVIDIHFTDE
jgi:predicted GNAT family acetyltransferase